MACLNSLLLCDFFSTYASAGASMQFLRSSQAVTTCAHVDGGGGGDAPVSERRGNKRTCTSLSDPPDGHAALHLITTYAPTAQCTNM